MKLYDTYKDSGIEWIGDIPEHWGVCKTAHHFNGIGSGTTPDTNSSKYYDENGFNWLQTGDLNDALVLATSKKISQLALDENSALRIYPKGSLVIAMYGATIGKVGILNFDSATNQACCVLPTSEKMYIQYGFYSFIASKQFLVYQASGGGQPNISQAIIRNHRLPVPPLPEQEKIAEYLDYKVGQIDELIADKEAQVSDLQKYRQSLISETVTRGLNPNAPLKNSGIEWIGKIPAHWEMKKLKHISTIVLGKMIMQLPPKGQEQQYTLEKYLKSRNVGWLEVLDDEIDEMWFNQSEKEIYALKENDIVMNEGGDIGKVAIWEKHDYECYIQNSVNKITANSNVCPQYLALYLYAVSKSGYFWSIVNQISIAHLTKEKLSSTLTLLPPLAEQQEIAEFLDNKTAQIAEILNDLQTQIADLKAYKTSLISEAVTGKIDLREWSNPEN